MAKETITQQRDRYQAECERLTERCADYRELLDESRDIGRRMLDTNASAQAALELATEMNVALVDRIEVDRRITAIKDDMRDLEDEILSDVPEDINDDLDANDLDALRERLPFLFTNE